jgi:diacylglycerol kinase (ATP)
MIRFLLNPSSGRGAGAKQLDRLRIAASRLGAGLAVSRSAGDLMQQARKAAMDGVERLLVAGGDGTMHWAIQGLVGTECALAPIPLGSGNDLAGTLGVPASVPAAIERATSAPIRAIDLLSAGGFVSVSYAGVGFDSEVTRVANQVHRLRGPMIYAWAVIKTLKDFTPPVLTVEHDHGRFEGRAMFAILNNLPRLGGGMKMAPDAVIDDGLLELVIVREVSKFELLQVFPKVYSGKHLSHPQIELIQTRTAQISVDRLMYLYGGGEPLAVMQPGVPSPLEVLPNALFVVG